MFQGRLDTQVKIRGNRLELDWLAGRVVELGRELNVPTPVNATIYAALKGYRMGKKS